MRSWTGIPELKQSYRTLGASRFWLLMLGTLAWIGVGTWLMVTLDYPQAYGSACHRNCLIEDFWFSPALLQHGGALDYMLFAWLCSMPAAIVGAFISTRLRKRRRSRNLIQPMTQSDPE